ncbi:MAG: UDP-N-acetylmuramoyl-L-alanyl-D-glutamate--2,6-diaminopimelate ligase [Bacillota bacterium]|nr:UDP-N-acetylmuramoyl-L-alanyl-D-glutamate--2,6-diaminopimelate ligase [Bacillota bacterium]
MVTNFHKLDEYIKLLEQEGLLKESSAESGADRDVRYISFDSQDVQYGTLFVCKGAHFKAEYLAGALEKGAFAYVSENRYDNVPEDVPFILVNDVRKAMVIIANTYYNDVWKDLTVIGITGTKGKSSTTYFMKYILDDWMKAEGKPETAVISGIDNYDGIIKEESHLTTPETMDLYRHFDNAVTSDIEFASMEVSSQALKYDRVSGMTFDVGCFLNIGTDHISDIEHPDFEDYLASKLILMGQCRNVCVNLDCDNSEDALAAAKASKVAERVITFGTKEGADIFGYDIKTSDDDITFKVKCDSFDEKFMITMHGLFNVENALAAIAMCYCLNVPLDYIKSGLKKARVSGRMEIFRGAKTGMTVIVDYAHNQMSFQYLFDSIHKEFPGSRVTIVFGCPGKKALGRRRELGSLAGEYADKVYITEEDAGEEPIAKISKEISEYVASYGTDFDIIDDRVEAITKAVNEADGNTVVLITGKGRETRQKRGTQYIDTPSDVEIVEKLLEDK